MLNYFFIDCNAHDFISFQQVLPVKMSHFVNCDDSGVRSAYDKMRSPMGADVVAGLLREHNGKPLKVWNQTPLINNLSSNSTTQLPS